MIKTGPGTGDYIELSVPGSKTPPLPHRIGGRTLIQMVPRCGAEPNGVADYALTLARALRTVGIESVFLSGAPCSYTPVGWAEWKTVAVARQQSRSLEDTLQSLTAATKAAAVLLHFSGYGYEKRGAPLWLLQGLRNWRRRTRHVPLVTIFHELYATGRPWHSAFWLSLLQKRIGRSILNLSSAAMTPTNQHGKRLASWESGGNRKTIVAMPVFSNVGEPGCGAPPCARPATAVVFGLAGVEDRLFGDYRSQIERIVPALGIEKIFDVGPRSSSIPRDVAGVPVISKGVLPPHAVSQLLQQARFGFIAYPVDVIGKSGVFAAYAAHGVVPIVLSEESRLVSFDGLQATRHFLDGLRLQTSVGADDLAPIQCDLFAWYASHALKLQADLLARLIAPDS